MTICSWFCPSRAPGKGVCGGAKFLAPPYYSQRAVFARLWALFILICLFICQLVNNFTQNFWLYLHGNCIRDVSLDKEVSIKFWQSSYFGSGSSNFWMNCFPLWNRDNNGGIVPMLSLNSYAIFEGTGCLTGDTHTVWFGATPYCDTNNGIFNHFSVVVSIARILRNQRRWLRCPGGLV